MSYNNTSSTTTLNLFVSILGGLGLLFTALNDHKSPFDWKDYLLGAILITTSLILAIILNWKKFNEFVSKKVEHIKILNSIVFESVEGRLLFNTPYGEKVVYTEQCRIKRIKSKYFYEGSVGSDPDSHGSINLDIQTFNCYNSINNRKNLVTIIYGRKKNGEATNMINKRQLQFGFSVTMENSFLKEKETWHSEFKHYTKVYELQMRFDAKNKPKYVDIEQEELNDKNEKIFKPLSTDPLIIETTHYIEVKFVLLHIRKGSVLRVVWEWDKAPSTALAKKPIPTKIIND